MESIELQQVLPRVFESERIPVSDIWLTSARFLREERYLLESASGGFKSSMCAYIFGSRTDYSGRILFDGEDTRGFDMARWQEIRRRHLAYLPQELSLFPELTAWENVQLKNRLTRYASDRMIAEWFGQLGIDSRRDTPAGRMSVGQQQRVAIILDEPVSHLDEQNNRIAAELIAGEAYRQGAGIISTSVGNHILIDHTSRLKL